MTIDVLDGFDKKTDDELGEEDEEGHINEVAGIVCPKCKKKQLQRIKNFAITAGK